MSAGRSHYLRIRGGLGLKLEESPLARILIAVGLFVWLAALITEGFLA